MTDSVAAKVPLAAAGAGATATDPGTVLRLLDLKLLTDLGWDAESEIFTPHPDHPQFGYQICSAIGCSTRAAGSPPVCDSCKNHWLAAGKPPIETFVRPGVVRDFREPELCLVCRTPGHERPARSHRVPLCIACRTIQKGRGQSVVAYVRGDGYFDPAQPRVTLGRCAVQRCRRWAAAVDTRLCDAHYKRWTLRGKPHGDALSSWCRTESAPLGDTMGKVLLWGIPETLKHEFLFGIQTAAHEGLRVKLREMRSAVNILARLEVPSLQLIGTISTIGANSTGLRFVRFISKQLALAFANPDDEVKGDIWDLRVFGLKHRLSFIEIRQPWLREAAKAWARRRIPTIRSPNPSTLRDVIVPLWHLSRSLATRQDGGDRPERLGRADIDAFTTQMAIKVARAEISEDFQSRIVKGADRFFRQARGWGLMAPGGPLAGLPDDFYFTRTDIPRPITDGRKRQAIPEEVMEQLFAPASLELLEQLTGPEYRRWLELQANVGRRPGEVCRLRWDCLAYDEQLDEGGQLTRLPVLVHDMPKSKIYGYRLPISTSTEAIVLAQQACVRERYPATPIDELMLFPSTHRSRAGRRPTNEGNCGHGLNHWLTARPEPLTVTDSVGNKHPYARPIVAYSFRHTYAQRHADAGTPIEVLAELMGHRHLSSTRAYYDVSNERQRQAIDLVAPLQLRSNGVRTRSVGRLLSESEALREHIGYVAVPFGGCTEPSNVRAHGRTCPFRHRCFGCVHFRTDPSYLPELVNYLSSLLADRERLDASEDLAQWDRTDARPSEEEIAAVRNLIRASEGLLNQLPEDERAAVDTAIKELRRHRAQLNSSVPIELRRKIRQEAPSATAFPRTTLEADRRVIP